VGNVAQSEPILYTADVLPDPRFRKIWPLGPLVLAMTLLAFGIPALITGALWGWILIGGIGVVLCQISTIGWMWLPSWVPMCGVFGNASTVAATADKLVILGDDDWSVSFDRRELFPVSFQLYPGDNVMWQLERPLEELGVQRATESLMLPHSREILQYALSKALLMTAAVATPSSCS